jgi:hypothetical protein
MAIVVEYTDVCNSGEARSNAALHWQPPTRLILAAASDHAAACAVVSTFLLWFHEVTRDPQRQVAC